MDKEHDGYTRPGSNSVNNWKPEQMRAQNFVNMKLFHRASQSGAKQSPIDETAGLQPVKRPALPVRRHAGRPSKKSMTLVAKIGCDGMAIPLDTAA